MNFTELLAMSGDQCCCSNYSILIPQLIYSGGDLAAAIIVTALLVAGISVAIHIAVFYWIYKMKLQPRMMKTDTPLRQQPKSSRSATEEKSADVDELTWTYEFMSDESAATTYTQTAAATNKSAKPIPAPKIKLAKSRLW